MKQTVYCEACGKAMERCPSQIRRHNFCSRECTKIFTSKRMTQYNKLENPMNTPEGWSAGQKEAARKREQMNKGPCGPNTYPKDHGEHEHRKVAAQILGRPLLPGEVVHHVDRDRHNNEPENLMVFPNQAEHRKWHAEHDEEVVL